MMTKKLIVFPTVLEAKPLLPSTETTQSEAIVINDHLEILISGIGMMATAYSITKAINTRVYDEVILAGIAGSFSNTLALGSCVFVRSECIGDLGLATEMGFNDLFDMKLQKDHAFPFQNRKLVNPNVNTKNLTEVQSISINLLLEDLEKNAARKKKFDVEIENMEGAALFWVGLHQNINFQEIRAISNYVGERDYSKWNINLAIQNLHKTLDQLIHF